MSKNSIKNIIENLFLMFGRGKTYNREKTYRSSTSALSAIFVLKESGTQSHSAKFLNWGDHVNSVPDLAAIPPCCQLSPCGHPATTDNPIIRTAAKSQALLRNLANKETNSRSHLRDCSSGKILICCLSQM